jgi:hypothetical protein
VHTFDISEFDYVLMNSTLHFYKADLEKEIALVKRILGQKPLCQGQNSVCQGQNGWSVRQ